MTLDFDDSIQTADSPVNCNQNVETEKEAESIINFLVEIDEVCFKSQQRGEADLTKIEKFHLGQDIFHKSKLQFLLRFGHYLLSDHLLYFEKFTKDNDELTIVLHELSKKLNDSKKSRNVKNRRFEALKEMISEDSYFSEIEMMKRNPLLYEQLVGQYLSKEEIKERDKSNTESQSSFVKILMEGIERNDAEAKKKGQEEIENNAMEESDSESDDERSRSPFQPRKLWGEYENEDAVKKPKNEQITNITAQERKLLKEEFVTTMYQSFLNGKDDDFDYTKVDHNSKYDNIETIEHDEEDKYFDSEEPETAPIYENDVSEDELDVFMSALNDNQAVRQLAKDMKNVTT